MAAGTKRRHPLSDRALRGLLSAMSLADADMQADTYDAETNSGGQFKQKDWDEHSAADRWLRDVLHARGWDFTAERSTRGKR